MNSLTKVRRLTGKQGSCGLALCLSGCLLMSSPTSWATEPASEALEPPATPVRDWMAQTAQVSITGIRVDETEAGVQIVLETAGRELTAPSSRTVGNALVADIPDAVLDLPAGEPFEQFSPAAGIALVSVTNQPEGGVRISITGTDAPPQVEVSTMTGNLVLSVTPGVETAVDVDEDAIQVVVTATRTEEELQDIPRSVTVITREEIEDQTRLNQDLGDILSQLVPGFSAPTGRTNTFGQSLRGRDISVLIDGVPQNTNLGSIPAFLTTIDPQAIERIEVVRGPNAIYGAQATGGLINIITRQPDEAPIRHTIDVGGSGAIANGAFLAEDGFGYRARYSVSATTDTESALGSISYQSRGVYYDANGDRIPSEYRDAETDEVNVLVRLGAELDPVQRLNFTFNYFRQEQDANYISDPEVEEIPGVQRARAIELPEGTQIIGAPDGGQLETTNLTLQYFNDDLLNSQLEGQVFFRDYAFVGGLPRDSREFFDFILQSPGDTQQWGGRLQVNTPFNPEETASLLWGVDYVRENSSQSFNIFDPEAFDESGGRIFRKIDQIDFVPPYTLNDLGIFAQLQWDISDRLALSSGARYVNLRVNADDYTTFEGNDVEGGTLNAEDFVFNAGLAYDITEALTAFTSFSQGFSLPDIGRVLRFAPAGFAVEADIDLTQPQKVDNYEIGLRGNWNSVQASLAGFYNYSSLGTNFEPTEGGPLRTIRAPQQVYGVEAALDWQPGDDWRLGSTVAGLEGEDENEDGEFTALNSLVIPPLKITAYVENETLPGWRNRLQLLYSGDRDRGFEAGTDDAPIDSYITLDLLSSVSLGGGELSLGIQNLLNTDYFPVYSQFFAPFSETSNTAAPGRWVTLSYRRTF
ncbi:TonB-dependent receptor [Romeria aff. gracilis LEGE 07310]|uniref:TonB-dependent receptor n=2 Tax=Vasconcelosia TaxID=3366328 RepID=A0A8J7A467_9CYAN|nr:TonB-dependent receptor [Romeria aff. gracilis LEGE 07310]